MLLPTGMLLPTLLFALTETVLPRVVEVTAARFQFAPGTIEVQEGEAISLRLRSADGTHGIEIKGYGLKLKIPKGGTEVRLDFVADKPGRFDFVCSEYCGSGHRGMRGKLIVKPRAR